MVVLDARLAISALVLHFDLAGGRSFVARNARTDQPEAALGANIPRLDFCELLFEPVATLRLEAGADGEAALPVQVFGTGELKQSGLCPLWGRGGAPE